MKKFIAGLFLVAFWGCYNENEEGETSTIAPTLDSNTIAPVVDSNTTLLYLDNPHSDTFSIAMDSAGATVTAADTSLSQQ